MNNKGFTLVELLAVIVILGIILAFMYPNVISLIENNKKENYNRLKKSIESATRAYISDYRYEISVNCSIDSNDCSITKINNVDIVDSNITVRYLIDDDKITLDKNGKIKNPANKKECLDTDASYVKVKYNSEKKDFNYGEAELNFVEFCT